ncbi:MAG: MFS transporter [Chloroflexi bacterium]|nr:MFS transporter [Chloroflexota bacterium]
MNYEFSPTVPLYRNRDYMLLWGGQVISSLGSAISGIVFPLLILALTNSPAAAGIAGALGSLPYLFLSLPAGALIDRWDRKRVMILCDTGRALAMASIAAALFFNALTIWQIYIVALIEGTLFVFFNIADTAAIPRVVPKEQLPEATGQNHAAQATTGIVGPSIGTVLYQSLGRAFPFLLDAISYGVSVVSLFFIKTNFQTERTVAQRHLLVEIREGLSWLFDQPLIRFMAFVTGGLNFVNAATGLFVIVLAKRLGASDAEIGIIFSIGAIGGIAGALVGGRIQQRFKFGQVIIATVWIHALVFPLYLLAPNIIVLGVISAFLYVTGPIYNVVQFSYRLALIPDRLQGRVNSSFRLIAFGFQPLGAALSGFLIERAGVVPALLAFAVWELGLSILVFINADIRNAPPLVQQLDV